MCKSVSVGTGDFNKLQACIALLPRNAYCLLAKLPLTQSTPRSPMWGDEEGLSDTQVLLGRPLHVCHPTT